MKIMATACLATCSLLLATPAHAREDDYIHCEVNFDNVSAISNVFRGDYSELRAIKEAVGRRAARRFDRDESDLQVLCFRDSRRRAAENDRERRLNLARNRSYIQARTFRFRPWR